VIRLLSELNQRPHTVYQDGSLILEKVQQTIWWNMSHILNFTNW